MRYGTNSSALRQNIRNRHSTLVACKHTVSGSFHSPSGVLFAFPSRYWFTIGQMRVFSLATWSWRFHAEFHVLRGTQDTASSSDFFAYGTITLYCRSFQRHSAKTRFFYLLNPTINRGATCGPTTLSRKRDSLGFSDFARHYYRNHFYSLFLRLLRCFTSPGCPP